MVDNQNEHEEKDVYWVYCGISDEKCTASSNTVTGISLDNKKGDWHKEVDVL